MAFLGLTVPYKRKCYTDVKLKSYYRKEIVPVILKAGFNIESSEKTLGFEDAGKKVLYWNYLLQTQNYFFEQVETIWMAGDSGEPCI